MKPAWFSIFADSRVSLVPNSREYGGKTVNPFSMIDMTFTQSSSEIQSMEVTENTSAVNYRSICCCVTEECMH